MHLAKNRSAALYKRITSAERDGVDAKPDYRKETCTFHERPVLHTILSKSGVLRRATITALADGKFLARTHATSCAPGAIRVSATTYPSTYVEQTRRRIGRGMGDTSLQVCVTL